MNLRNSDVICIAANAFTSLAKSRLPTWVCVGEWFRTGHATTVIVNPCIDRRSGMGELVEFTPSGVAAPNCGAVRIVVAGELPLGIITSCRCVSLPRNRFSRWFVHQRNINRSECLLQIFVRCKTFGLLPKSKVYKLERNPVHGQSDPENRAKTREKGAGVHGDDPWLKESESFVLPITPHPSLFQAVRRSAEPGEPCGGSPKRSPPRRIGGKIPLMIAVGLRSVK